MRAETCQVIVREVLSLLASVGFGPTGVAFFFVDVAFFFVDVNAAPEK
jgi:hypothetical protein